MIHSLTEVRYTHTHLPFCCRGCDDFGWAAQTAGTLGDLPNWPPLLQGQAGGEGGNLRQEVVYLSVGMLDFVPSLPSFLVDMNPPGKRGEE